MSSQLNIIYIIFLHIISNCVPIVYMVLCKCWGYKKYDRHDLTLMASAVYGEILTLNK